MCRSCYKLDEEKTEKFVDFSESAVQQTLQDKFETDRGLTELRSFDIVLAEGTGHVYLVRMIRTQESVTYIIKFNEFPI